MAGQAARKTRSEIASTLSSLNLSPQKKSPTGGDPVCHPNFYGNPALSHSGEIIGKTKKIKLQSKIQGY